MKLEFSAGGIVFRDQRSKIKDQKDTIMILLCQHSQNHGWGFPKGLIGDKEAGETKESTALREVKEETGAKGEILEELEPATYWYAFQGEKIKKTVYYYIMQFEGGDITKHDLEMENVEWIPVDSVLNKLTYKTDKGIFTKAKPKIEKLVSNMSS